jgi:hypothetical protein
VVLAEGAGVTLGLAERQGDLLDDLTRFCGEVVDDDSIYGLLHRERDRLFADEAFADLYTHRGRRSVPPSVLACVMVLQRLEGCSDREAVDRFTFDARWRYACGVGGWESGPTSFVHTVLVRTRMRLRDSADPDRVFRVSKEVAADAGLLGAKRVLDSAPLHDAVATQDTVTVTRPPAVKLPVSTSTVSVSQTTPASERLAATTDSASWMASAGAWCIDAARAASDAARCTTVSAWDTRPNSRTRRVAATRTGAARAASSAADPRSGP